MFPGTASATAKRHPAWSSRRTAWASDATMALISARCAFIASVSKNGMTSPAPLPSAGQIAPINSRFLESRLSCLPSPRIAAALGYEYRRHQPGRPARCIRQLRLLLPGPGHRPRPGRVSIISA